MYPTSLGGHEYEIVDELRENYWDKTTGEVQVTVEGVEREKKEKEANKRRMRRRRRRRKRSRKRRKKRRRRRRRRRIIVQQQNLKAGL